MNQPADISTVCLMMGQISGAARPARAKRKFNPNPPGTIQQGSATEAVFAFLLESTRFFTHAQICFKTGKSHSAVSWALIKLRNRKRIEVIEDATRNSRYFRYRAKREGDK